MANTQTEHTRDSEHARIALQYVTLPHNPDRRSIATQTHKKHAVKTVHEGKKQSLAYAGSQLSTSSFPTSPPSHVESTQIRRMSSPRRTVAFLVASLGNPPPYHLTRHSVGHLVLKYVQNNMSLPSFTMKSKLYGGGHVSIGADVGKPEFTLWQSPSLMNTSGVALLKAYKQFVSVQQASPIEPVTGLIILHDEMETEPGKLKVRRGGNTSAKGHNGIKSVQASLQGGGILEKLADKFIKIGVGIGRPSGGSRESRDVSAYVLGQLTTREKDGLDHAARDVEDVMYQEMARIMQQSQ